MENEILTPDLRSEVITEPFGTAKYWKLRCQYLEKSHDLTYGLAERANCYKLYILLVVKER